MCREDELLASSYPRGNGNYMTIQTQNQQAEGLRVGFGCASPESRHVFSHHPARGLPAGQVASEKHIQVTIS